MITNILLSGVGGQGTITASNVLAQAALLAGWQVKKSEISKMRTPLNPLSLMRLGPQF